MTSGDLPPGWALAKLGDLPSGWALTTLGDVFEIVGGATPRTDNMDY